MQKHFLTIKELKQEIPKTISLQSKYFNFTKYLDGGRIFVLGGSTGIGKTNFALQTMLDIVTSNQNIIGVYIFLEMMPKEIYTRIHNISNLFNVDIDSLPILFFNKAHFSLPDLKNMIVYLEKEYPNKNFFIVLDYIQLLFSENIMYNSQQIIEIKNLLKQTNSNICLISSLNRDSINKNLLHITAFKDNSLIEYSADIAALLVFKEKNQYKILTSSFDNKKQIPNSLYIVKNRLGPKIHEDFLFIPDTQSFIKKEEGNIQNTQTQKKLNPFSPESAIQSFMES